MAQAPLRVDVVAHELLKFFCFRKTTLHGSVPYERVVDVNLEDASCTGDECDFAYSGLHKE
ncbi:MAG: hypothetical protein AVDCRST_MAG86-3166 [uncultured Truepera sp.]|uniref:Uncharacterized protein n=1 Tax=uncultured Truepera sp. TaxID=543023 RepID=A0A6J4VMT5_9DEIN|nr:MAG: hypothetical protein AVDCRST_MAG86-3166 [uncultured Truepera sp.]